MKTCEHWPEPRRCREQRLWRRQVANLCLKGPEWLADPERWPAEILTERIKETEAAAKLTKEVLGTIVETKDDLDETLNKHGFWKAMRVTAWIMRFVGNCKQKKSEWLAGPLTTPETDKGSLLVGENSARKQHVDRKVWVGPVEPKFTEEQWRDEWISGKNTRKLSSLPATKCSVIREVNTRCPCMCWHYMGEWASPWPTSDMITAGFAQSWKVLEF